jgi:hypothetical protein
MRGLSTIQKALLGRCHFNGRGVLIPKQNHLIRLYSLITTYFIFPLKGEQLVVCYCNTIIYLIYLHAWEMPRKGDGLYCDKKRDTPWNVPLLLKPEILLIEFISFIYNICSLTQSFICLIVTSHLECYL